MKLSFFVLFLTALVGSANAQFLKIGPVVGANLQKIDGQSFKDGYQLGYYAGAFVEVKLGSHFQLQPELIFSENKFDQASEFRDVYKNILNTDSLTKIKLQKLSIPVLLNFKIANIIALQAGPQFSLIMDKNKTLLKNSGDAFTDGDFAMVGGVKVMIGKLRFTGRYVVGLSDINNVGDVGKQDKWKSQTAQLGVGFVF
jgi:hypothetical protein